MNEITLIDPDGYDLSETILIDYRLYHAKHQVCQLCGDESCVQYWTKGNGVSESDSGVLSDTMIHGKLFGRCQKCRIEYPSMVCFFRPRLDLFPLDDLGFPGLSVDIYDPNRDSIVSDSSLIEWIKING